MYHVPLAVQRIYGWSNERGEDGDGKEGSEFPRGWERVEIEAQMEQNAEGMEQMEGKLRLRSDLF